MNVFDFVLFQIGQTNHHFDEIISHLSGIAHKGRLFFTDH
jgi:hypothetical protein